MTDDAPFPFDTLEATFTALTSGPAPLALDGRHAGHGLPARLLPLDELRRLLLDPSMGFAARDATLAAERLLERERVWHARTTGVPRSSAPPPRPAGHPDFVLARAVRERVLSAEDAELVGETRIGRVRLCDLARAWDQPYKTLAKRRDRAERALVRWLSPDRMSNFGGRTPVLGRMGARGDRGTSRTPVAPPWP